MESKFNLSINNGLLRICIMSIFFVISSNMFFGQTIDRKAILVIDVQ